MINLQLSNLHFFLAHSAKKWTVDMRHYSPTEEPWLAEINVLLGTVKRG